MNNDHIKFILHLKHALNLFYSQSFMNILHGHELVRLP